MWREVDKENPLGALTNTSFAALTRAPFAFASALPFPYQWALGRAALLTSLTKETDKYCDKLVEIVTDILDEADGELWEVGFCQLTSDNPFPPIIAKPHMAGYKAPAKKAEGSDPAQATP